MTTSASLEPGETEALTGVVVTTAQPVAATNCLNFGNPEKPEVMWQFREAIDGIAEACRELEIPITGGNVSFYNETLGRAIAPTPILGVLGIIEDAERALGMGFQKDGDAIVLLDAGKCRETTEEMRRDTRKWSTEFKAASRHGSIWRQKKTW